MCPTPKLPPGLDMLESSVRVKVTRCLRKAMDIAGGTGMDHILEQMADSLENRLTPEQRREVEMRRDRCSECGAALAFAMKLQAEALAQGLAHIRPDRIIALSGNRDTATPAEQQQPRHVRELSPRTGMGVGGRGRRDARRRGRGRKQ